MTYHRLLPALLVAGLLLTTAIGGCAADPAPRPTQSPAPAPSPTAIGASFAGEGWALTVTQVSLDATAEVAAANEFNPEPAAGEQYALVEVTLTRTAEPRDALDVDVTLLVKGEQVAPAPAVAPSPLHLLNEFDTGTPVTGQLAFLVPAGTNTAQVQVELSPTDRFLVPAS